MISPSMKFKVFVKIFPGAFLTEQDIFHVEFLSILVFFSKHKLLLVAHNNILL